MRSSRASPLRSAVFSIMVKPRMKRHVPKTRVEFPGIPGWDRLPYAIAGGMVINRSPPICMPATPTSQPLMTSPLPKRNLNYYERVNLICSTWRPERHTGWPLVLESNILPLVSLPT